MVITSRTRNAVVLFGHVGSNPTLSGVEKSSNHTGCWIFLHPLQKHRLEIIFLRAVYLYRHILRYQVGFHGVFQRLMDHSMIVNHEIRLDRPQLFGIKLLDMPYFQFFQRNWLWAEIRLKLSFPDKDGEAV